MTTGAFARSARRIAPLLVLAMLSGRGLSAEELGHGLLLRGQEAESFLKTAEVTAERRIGVGITNPKQITLSDGSRTLRAAWKTVDVYRPGITRFESGGFELNFRDSYKHEIAAYELDKLLGLGLVPPTVERVLKREKGALQLWVEGCVTEHERQERKMKPPDLLVWNRQMYKVRLLHQLTYNTDRTNIRNVLVDPDFRIYAIDHSRAFRPYDELVAPEELTHFSRTALQALRDLDPAVLQARLGDWLDKPQLEGIVRRRDRILALAERLVAEQGEAEVLDP